MENTNPKWTGYFKVVEPAPLATKMTDSQEMADAGAYNNYTWYQRLIQGSASRMTRYREYDLMDNDIEISRALDTIAEEMTGNNPKTKDPIEIDLITDMEDSIPPATVLTLKAALRRFNRIHDMKNRLYQIARTTIKYGDLFFKRQDNPFALWEFIHPKNVVAAIVDAEDATKIVGWQIKTDVKKPRSGGYSMPLGAKEDTATETEIVSARQIVRFALSDDMSDTQPFGESVLRPVYRVHKQKELLEDAVIIYRVQRAPERRVFYIDVGKMPPQRVKQYLENIKNEIKQKKVPTLNGGQSEVDSVYNPQSMCLALDTEIPLLDGRTETLQTLINEHQEGKENWVYSIDPDTGSVVPGPISWAGITQTNAETIKLTLDNNDEIICTPEHKFPIQGRGFVQAKDITPDDSLWPFNVKHEQLTTPTGKNTGEYTHIYNPATKSWKMVHRLVANYMLGRNMETIKIFNDNYTNESKHTIHHLDFNSKNNIPSNLAFMHHRDHVELHGSLKNQEAVFSDDLIQRFVELANENIYIGFKDLLLKLNADDTFMKIYADTNVPIRGSKLKTDQFRQKMFLVFIKCVGFKNWKEYQQSVIQSNIDIDTATTKAKTQNGDDVKLIQYILSLIKNVGIHNFKLVNHLKDHIREWNKFCKLYENVFCSKFKNRYKQLNTPEASMFERISKYFGYNNFKHLVAESANFNHRVVKIEKWKNQDVGTLTIDQEEVVTNNHTFALTSCFTKNSEDFFFASRPDGRSSRVETLPGGQGLGELADLEYFQRKVWRGLKVPVSYMIEQQEGGQIWNDGKVGIAYIQELRFSLYVERLQAYLEKVLDEEFKRFIRQNNIQIDEECYELVLPEPSNYGKYRQYELDSQLLSSYGSADSIGGLSTRFKLKRFLQISDDELKVSEYLKCEELGLDPNGDMQGNLKHIYGDPNTDAMGGGIGGGGFGGGFGGSEVGMGTGGEPGGEPGVDMSAGGESGAGGGGAPSGGGLGGAT